MTRGALQLLGPALLLLLLAAAPAPAHADKNKFYYVEALCKHFLQQLQYRNLDGGVLWSRNERNLDCTLTFQTFSILQRFMLHFDMLQLDCNDHLYVYDGAHPTGPPRADLSCRHTHATLAPIFTRSNYLTLKYVTDNWGTDANGFKLVITAIKDPKHGCKEFRCVEREFCISSELVCDGVNHCADGSDEHHSLLCPDVEGVRGRAVYTWAVVVSATLALLGAASVWAWRRRAPALTGLGGQHHAPGKGPPNLTALRSQHEHEHEHEREREREEALVMTHVPGNWTSPAGPRARRRTPRRPPASPTPR